MIALLENALKFILGQPYLVSVFLTLLFLRAYVINHRNNSKTTGPPRVPYLLPWIGSALEMGKDPDAFFERANSELGHIFKVKAVGRDITYITSPELISAIYRDPKTFEFTPIRLEMTNKVFGVSWEATYSSFMQDGYLPMHHHNLSPKNIVGMLECYAQYAREDILRAVDRFDGETTPLISFIIPPAYSSAARAFFGRSFDAEKTYEPFCRFDKYFHLLAAGVPRFLMPGPRRAWDEIGLMFERYLQRPHEDCCEMIQLVEAMSKDAGWVNRDIARVMATELWAMEANATWAAYWVVVLALQRPQGLDPLITEIDLSKNKWKMEHPDDSLESNLHGWLSSSALPLLTSTIQESLRLSTSTFSIRRISQPAVFGGYQFKTGERIVCATRSVHLDEEIHPKAHEFVSDRYIEAQSKFTKNGKVVPNHSMPFGGGVSMCEGRHFALGELKIFLALLLSYTTIELNPGSTARPTYYKERIGVGLMPPVGDLSVCIRRRNVA